MVPSGDRRDRLRINVAVAEYRLDGRLFVHDLGKVVLDLLLRGDSYQGKVPALFTI